MYAFNTSPEPHKLVEVDSYKRTSDGSIVHYVVLEWWGGRHRITITEDQHKAYLPLEGEIVEVNGTINYQDGRFERHDFTITDIKKVEMNQDGKKVASRAS